MHGDAAEGVADHLLVDLVDTTLQGLYQSATSNDGVEVHGYLCLLQFVDQHLFTKILLKEHIVESRQLFCRVYDCSQEDWLLVFIDGHLC